MRRIVCCLCLVGLLLACDRSDRAARPATIGDSIPGAPTTGLVSFRYAPRDGEQFVQSRFTRVKVTTAVEPIVTVSSEETEEQVAVRIEKVWGGYRMTESTLSVRSRSNGSRYNNRYLMAKIGLDLTYQIDENGKVVAVDGLDELADRVRKVAAEEGRNLIQDLIVREQAKEFWNERVGGYAGASVSLGGTTQLAVPRMLPNGKTISLTQEVSVPRFAACPAGRCVLVYADSSSSDSALIELTVELLAQGPCAAFMAQRWFRFNVRAALTGTSASASRVIDPDTMLIYKDSGTETTNATLEAAGESGAFRLVREWEYRVDPARDVRAL